MIEGVATQAAWWIDQRRKKLRDLQHGTHAVNPFLWPLLGRMHGFATFRDLAEFQLAGHLVEGHATGFGKLVDEKILPAVFGTTKLDKATRKGTIFERAEFDNIDHLIGDPDSGQSLLSLKAGRWSIQLGQAKQLNTSLAHVISDRTDGLLNFDQIVIGVFYGVESQLGDKYRIIRGEPTMANHDLDDITSDVVIHAGQDFWSWLNGDERDTDSWVLEGLMAGFESDIAAKGDLASLHTEFIDDYVEQFREFETENGEISWHALLRAVNGRGA